MAFNRFWKLILDKSSPIPLFKVFTPPDLLEKACQVIESGFVGQGPVVEDFEQLLGQRLETPHVLTLNSCTSSLQLALRLCTPVDNQRRFRGCLGEIISTPLTCTATNMPILEEGFKIVWADVERDCNISVKSIRENITDSTVAIVVVHWGGYPCNMEEIYTLARYKNLYVIEDCAHAWLSGYKDQVLGSRFADFSCFSFQAIKHLTTIDGGALTTKTKESYERGKLLRWYGIDREKPRTNLGEADIPEWGGKLHMNDFAAALGIQQLKYTDQLLAKHRKNGNRLDLELANMSHVEIAQPPLPDKASTYWLYTIHVENRADFINKMNDKNISVSLVHGRNDKHTCFVNAGSTSRDLSGLDAVEQTRVCIPVGWWVSESELEYIISCIADGW